MRSAPPLHLDVTGYGLWRAAVLLLAASAGASMGAWWWAQPSPVPLWAGALAGFAALTSAGCAAALWRAKPLTLHWDRQGWRLAPGGAAEQPGELALAIDLGSWMLLRFTPEAGEPVPAWRRRPTWVALQRYGLERQWHALRCAAYSARPDVPPDGDFGVSA